MKVFRSVCPAFVLALLFALPSIASDQRNTRLPVVQTTGSVIVQMSGQFVSSPTDSFTLQKQVFTGSTDCSTGGGAVVYVQGITAVSTNSTPLTASDSVVLNVFPSSDANAQFYGLLNSDGATYTYLPGNAVCVAGFASGTHTFVAKYYVGIETLNATCTAPQYYFQPGGTICVHVAGTTGTIATPWHVVFYGGSPNLCYSWAGLTTNITAESQNITVALPASNAAIPGACSGGTTDIRGQWQAYLQDNLNSTMASTNFRLHDTNAFADMSTYVNSVSDLNDQSSFPPTGYLKMQSTVQNSGPDAAPNVTATFSVPASTTFISFAQTYGVPMSCTGPAGGNMTCTAASFPPDQYANFTMKVSYSALTNGTTLSTTALVASGATDPSPSNNSSNGNALITNNTNVGQFICRSDITTFSTSASGTNVTYNPPASFTTTYTYTGGNFNPTPANGGLFPIGDTPMTYQSIQGNGACTFHVVVNDGQRPDLTIVKSHPGVFRQGQSGQIYSITVKNTGAVQTVGGVTVKDKLPVGIFPSSITGIGWTCSLSTLSCARSDALPSGGSYPPIYISVDIPSTAPLNITNTAVVLGGGEGITTNDQSDDSTQIAPPGPSITAPSAVTSVNAVAGSSSLIQVTWSGSCSTACHVYRSADHVNYVLVGATTASPFNDTSVSPNTAYLYKTRAFNGTESADSNTALATAISFTDNPLVLGVTVIKSAHLAELRTAVNAVRTLAGLGTATFTRSGAAGTTVAAVDITELRTDLDQAMTILGFPTGGYTDATLTAGSTVIKTSHFQELRNRVQ